MDHDHHFHRVESLPGKSRHHRLRRRIKRPLPPQPPPHPPTPHPGSHEAAKSPSAMIRPGHDHLRAALLRSFQTRATAITKRQFAAAPQNLARVHQPFISTQLWSPCHENNQAPLSSIALLTARSLSPGTRRSGWSRRPSTDGGPPHKNP